MLEENYQQRLYFELIGPQTLDIETAYIVEVIFEFNRAEGANARFMPLYYISDYVAKTEDAPLERSKMLAAEPTEASHQKRRALLNAGFELILSYLKASPYIRDLSQYLD